MTKPKPKVEITTKKYNISIRITCIGSDAHLFVKELSKYGNLIDLSLNEKIYKIYILYVLDNYSVNEVNDYILSYNDLEV